MKKLLMVLSFSAMTLFASSGLFNAQASTDFEFRFGYPFYPEVRIQGNHRHHGNCRWIEGYWDRDRHGRGYWVEGYYDCRRHGGRD